MEEWNKNLGVASGPKNPMAHQPEDDSGNRGDVNKPSKAPRAPQRSNANFDDNQKKKKNKSMKPSNAATHDTHPEDDLDLELSSEADDLPAKAKLGIKKQGGLKKTKKTLTPDKIKKKKEKRPTMWVAADLSSSSEDEEEASDAAGANSPGIQARLANIEAMLVSMGSRASDVTGAYETVQEYNPYLNDDTIAQGPPPRGPPPVALNPRRMTTQAVPPRPDSHELAKRLKMLWGAGPAVHNPFDRAQQLNSNHSEEGLESKPPSRPDFRRVDWIWDSSRFSYKLQDSAKVQVDPQYPGYVFLVRRIFDHEGKFVKTLVDIKSKLLRECLQDVIGNVTGVSLVDESPKLNPNLLFLYVDDFRTHLSNLKGLEPAGNRSKERKKNQKRLDDKRAHLKVLIKYLDADYAHIKEALDPMLKNGLITFEYLWALWKPGTLVYAPTYGSSDTPRVYRCSTAERHSTIDRGDLYYVEGKYLEYDGKKFGHGTVMDEVPEFQGARKIVTLQAYPLCYRKDEQEVRHTLIERGKKFVALGGTHFKSYSGIAYQKQKKGVAKFDVNNSRIMVDPATFRRIHPNYRLSVVNAKNHDVLTTDESDSEDNDFSSSSDEEEERKRTLAKKNIRLIARVCKGPDGKERGLYLPQDPLDGEQSQELLEELPNGEPNGKRMDRVVTKGNAEIDSGLESHSEETLKDNARSASEDQGQIKTPDSSSIDHGIRPKTRGEELSLSDNEYLIASPVVLGFSFADKHWLEFSVSRIKEVQWNKKAWEQLVLKEDTKDLIQALVKSRKYHAASTIDDIIQGKGKGLVTVLHGPPGTGKTLTAEGISELLKCPLYMVSAGELGTDSARLEQELQRILNICHTWGAILLLDEADVFLEKRNMQDIHRNALVSVFLRLLEYFQGVLFLTTNRVETFDEAFQSRIHIALRYDKLEPKAKKAIFKLFIDRVKEHGRLGVQEFSEEDLTKLSRYELNGREIKNVMGSAQDMAINKGESLSMRHINLVLDVHAKFGQDLNGGTGYEDAMRSYF